jgi:hypothetical protein
LELSLLQIAAVPVVPLAQGVPGLALKTPAGPAGRD